MGRRRLHITVDTIDYVTVHEVNKPVCHSQRSQSGQTLQIYQQ